jgi:di/tricarboxylate transporter
MTVPQFLAFSIIAVTMGLFVWGRLRFDLVALLALLAGIVSGIVPPDTAFSGFSDDIVIIVASALLVSAAVERSGIVSDVFQRIGPYLTTTTVQVAVLVGTVTVLSGFVKNIGALAMLMPVAFFVARRNKSTPSNFLMPMAFGSLLGGIVTLIGTSPNIIVARVREQIVGEPFGMFDFTPVGICIALAGVAFLTFGWRLLPQDRKGAASMDAAFILEGYTTEVRVPRYSPAIDKTVGQLEGMADDEVEVAMIVRERTRHFAPADDSVVRVDDILLIEGQTAALERIVDKAKLELAGEATTRPRDTPSDEVGVMEAVVTDKSLLVGRTPSQVRLDERYGVHLLAVSRSGKRITQRMRAVSILAGDVVVLRGNLTTMPESLGELRCLPLAGRDLRLGRRGRSVLPLLVLAIAMGLVATHVVPVAVGFFGAAVVLLLLKSLTLIDRRALSATADRLPAPGALALIMVAAMAVTPFLNNAATVLVMAPIAASFADSLGYDPDPFLMAVAIGAACDFLTPIGHQSNLLVMGPGGYSFGDYWRLGLPLSIMVVVVGVPLIALFWPFKPV